MGYNTYFGGQFELNKPLDEETYNLLVSLHATRRMKRDMKRIFPDMTDDEILAKWGIDGEFYMDGEGFAGQDDDRSIVEYNYPPSTQPSLWCQWIPTEDRQHIEWDGEDNAYEMDEWIKYIIRSILEPRGYVLNGTVDAEGEDRDDRWCIVIVENFVIIKTGHWEWD